MQLTNGMKYKNCKKESSERKCKQLQEEWKSRRDLYCHLLKEKKNR